MAVIFGLTLNGNLWKECSWVSKTGQVPENFFDNLDANSDFNFDEYLDTERFEREISDEEVENYQHLEWFGSI